MKYKTVKIPEVVFFQEGPGVRNTQFTEIGVKLLNVGNINHGKLDLNATKIHISETEAYGKYSHFLVEPGDLLIASSGIVVDNFPNKIAWAGVEHLPLCMNTSTIRFKTLDSKVLDIQFFSFFLKSKIFTDQLRRLITGSAQLNFGPSHLRQISMPLPPLSEQKRIAGILDAADRLRQQDKALIGCYNQLAQSVFLEMFGDPEFNVREFPVVRLGDVATKITDGVHAKPTYVDEGVPFISVKDITTGSLEFGSCKFVSNAEHQSFIRRCKPEFMDVLYTKVGATYGRPALVNTNAEFSLYVSVALIKPDHKRVDARFLNAAMASNATKRQADKSIKGIGVPDLHLNMIREFKIPLPPLPLQQKFAEVIENIEHQKAQAEASGKESEGLFQSLLQAAFKGEL